MVQAGALDAGAVARGRGVVQGQQPARARVNGAAEVAEEEAGAGGNLAPAEGAEQGVGAAEVVGDATGAEPGGGGASAMGQEFADEEGLDEFGVARIEQGGGLIEEALDGVGRLSEDRGWLSRSWWQGEASCYPPSWRESIFRLKLLVMG
jgi:hypothetical protein